MADHVLGRPLAVRAQALALVIVAMVALGGAGGAATVGALSLLDGDEPGASPTLPVEIAVQQSGPLAGPLAEPVAESESESDRGAILEPTG